MAEHEDTDWRELCKDASEEQNPRKLLALLRQINDALAAQRARTPEVDQHSGSPN